MLELVTPAAFHTLGEIEVVQGPSRVKRKGRRSASARQS